MLRVDTSAFGSQLSALLLQATNEQIAKIDQKLEEGSIRIEEQAKLLAPVDTGALRNSIKQKKIGPLKYEVVAGSESVEYAAAVHNGTRKMAARPFLSDSYVRNKNRIIAEIEEVLGE